MILTSQSHVPELPTAQLWVSGGAKLVMASVPLHMLELSFSFSCIVAKVSVLLNRHYYLSAHKTLEQGVILSRFITALQGSTRNVESCLQSPAFVNCCRKQQILPRNCSRNKGLKPLQSNLAVVVGCHPPP